MNGEGLTTTKAPFIENAIQAGKRFIDQPYELYSVDNHKAWRQLYERIKPRWERYAHHRFLEGVNNLALDPIAIPRLEDINQFLAPLSGFKAKGVSGYVPAYIFFDALRQREFPTTITIRDLNNLDYLPEPDIFHDVAGHVPMHTDRQFSDVLVRLGEVARTAANLAAETKDTAERVRRTENIIKAMARFFCFTIEFGLIRDKDKLKVYGSGLLSSFGELAHVVESSEFHRHPFQLEWVVNQYFEIDHFQPLLFIVDSFDHLYSEVDRFEQWMLEGRLNVVSPGEPLVNEEDLKSFLHLADSG